MLIRGTELSCRDIQISQTRVFLQQNPQWSGMDQNVELDQTKEPYPERDHSWNLLQKDAPGQIVPLGATSVGLSAVDRISVLETNAFCISQGDLVLPGVRLHASGRNDSRRGFCGLPG